MHEAARLGIACGSADALTLVPGESGAFDCALKYRPLFDKQPAGDIGSRLLGSYAITLFGAAASWARDARLVQDLIPKDDPQFVRGL